MAGVCIALDGADMTPGCTVLLTLLRGLGYLRYQLVLLP